MGNAACCRNNPSFAEIASDIFNSHTNIATNQEDIRKEQSTTTKAKIDLAYINLTEWSTSERMARVQEIDYSPIALSMTNTFETRDLKITPKGIESSKRNLQDGVVYFGCKYKDLLGNYVVDVKCKLANEHFNNKFRGPHFMIYFDLTEHAYFLHDFPIGFGTFIKITEIYTLENDSLLSIGETFILVNILYKNNEDTFPKLRLKIFRTGALTEVYSFHAQEFYMCRILIGRSKKCNVVIDDGMISKIHANVVFNNQKKWIIEDGTGDECSLNGMWVFANQDFRIVENMEFKACESFFRVLSL
ncbi:hypothetical protein SteCoe_8096 [Stentor coeruleus]|uniref:FHA domain-containing protein n=1 Tax=Stentor coeruleus TaxID=5963 RepID=A0A1R2CL69_9CILI|nr:hypothetical protein SteCoe_8096 [Stentor coeruleus]